MAQQIPVRYNRYKIIGLGVGLTVVVLSACASGATPTPTAAVATPTRAAAPAASPTGAAAPAASPTAGAAAQVTSPTAAAKTQAAGNPQQGQQAIGRYGCGSCHTIPGVPNANGTTAPSLAGVGSRQQIAGVLPNTPDNMARWIQDPQAVKSGTRMPSMGVTESDARDIAAYLETLK
ncbi:MAG: c-type cytochrome [Chloroflexi bacterium]|nr:c-type cytochrome [Chloroflexota bacterium]